MAKLASESRLDAACRAEFGASDSDNRPKSGLRAGLRRGATLAAGSAAGNEARAGNVPGQRAALTVLGGAGYSNPDRFSRNSRSTP